MELNKQQVNILQAIEDFCKKYHRQPCQSDIARELKTHRENIRYYINDLKKGQYIKIEQRHSRLHYISILNKKWRKDIKKGVNHERI